VSVHGMVDRLGERNESTGEDGKYWRKFIRWEFRLLG
jgi:hypothetical protein